MTAFQAIIAVLENYTGEKITSALVQGFEGSDKAGRLVFPYYGNYISCGYSHNTAVLTYRGVTRKFDVREVWGKVAVQEM